MSKLPAPLWLTLPETVDWLVERGASEADVKSGLPRAFSDGQIRTRGYNADSRVTFGAGHGEISSRTWFGADIEWSSNSFKDREQYDFTDVGVSREDLSKWIGEEVKTETIAFMLPPNDNNPLSADNLQLKNKILSVLKAAERLDVGGNQKALLQAIKDDDATQGYGETALKQILNGSYSASIRLGTGGHYK
jgi:hypothetical protein